MLKEQYKFDDCPNHFCKNGIMFDFDLKKDVPCPHCSQKKLDLVIKNPVLSTDNMLQVRLSDVLCIPEKQFKQYRNFDFDKVILNQDLIEDSNLRYIRDQMEKVYSQLVLGEKLDASYCFGIGNWGNLEALVYPFVQKAYLAGLTVTRLISVSDLRKLETDDVMLRQKKYDEYIYADVCFVLIAEGISRSRLEVLQGFMQDRARLGRATIFVTTAFYDRCQILLSHPFENRLFRAKPVFAKYNKGKIESVAGGQAYCFDIHDTHDYYDCAIEDYDYHDKKIDSDY